MLEITSTSPCGFPFEGMIYSFDDDTSSPNLRRFLLRFHFSPLVVTVSAAPKRGMRPQTGPSVKAMALEVAAVSPSI